MRIASRYEIIKELGSGGMSVVYLALDTILQREVAIKVLKGDMSDDPVSLERFKREANTLTKLSHPNAVDVYDVGDDHNTHYIVMEYVKGYTLKQLIKRRGALPYKEAVWIMKQVSSALLEAHKNGIIHRDIKSQNILIKDDGTVKLADFGIAVLNNAMQLTSKGAVLGSVHYLAPELAKGKNADMQSDIYSLGIVFYELLTGDVPYKEDTPIKVALDHINKNVPLVRKFNPSIPIAVSNIVVKATARSKKERYSNVALMLKDLNRCLTKEAINDKPLILSEPCKEKVEDKKLDVPKKKKRGNLVNIFFILTVSIVSIVAIVLILFMTGIISNDDDRYATVPDLYGLSLTLAEDVLSPLGLSIDNANIKWVMTDDVDSNLIVSFLPNEGTKIEKGSKITVTVSEGKYSVMENYVGKDINEVKEKLKNTKFSIEWVASESSEKSGTILSQSIAPNEKYNPNISNKLIFTYSASSSIIIPFDILGKNIDNAANELSSQGFTVTKELVDYESLSDKLKEQYKNMPGVVVEVSPSAGSLYTQSDDSSIILKYYN